jgi:hypothetical protein
MDGFFEILIMVLMVWLFSRGAKKKKRPPRPPEAGTEERGEQQPLDWDKAIGDVLEGFGLQRPEQQKPRPEQGAESRARPEHATVRSDAEARRRAELARQLEVQRAEAQRGTTRTAEQRGWEVRDVTRGPAAEAGRGRQRARSSDLAEIAGLAEAAARRRAGTSAPPASMRATHRAEAATPGAAAAGATPPAEVQRSTARGLKKLEGLSELERAIIYAEILGPPKALRSDEGADW